ncbi:MAG: C40 family peptidase [Clostridia bacterium]|nr:C40 family peptidase [Clostridia bacterium]
MTNFKKAILLLITVLLILLAISQIVFGADTGKALKEAKLKKAMDDESITLEIIPKNDEFEILEDQGDWYKVNYQKIKGYVKKEEVEVKKQENSEENLTNEQENQVTNENQVSNNTVVEEPTNEIEIKIGDKLYTKSELQVFLRPLLNSMKIETLSKNQEVSVIEVTNKWVYVSVNGKTGWIRKELLATTDQNQTGETSKEDKKEETNYINKTGYVTSDGINFREEPNTDSKVLKTFLQNAKVTILLEEGDWYKVKNNDQVGYILKMYVSEKKVTVTSRSSETRTQNTQKVAQTTTQTSKTTETTNTNNTSKETLTTTSQSSSKGSQIVALAKKYLGCKYVYGGATPSGFDCSGFTMYLYKQFGVSLPHSATAQSSKGTKVAKSNLQPGDIVFFTNFRTNKGIGHCGIYIGNNQFIHASTEKTGVITSSLSSGSYQKRYVTAVRIF